MLEFNKLTVIEIYLGDLVDYLPVDKETDFLTEEAEKEAELLDNESIYGLYTFECWADFKARCPICYGVVSSVVTLADVDQIHIRV